MGITLGRIAGGSLAASLAAAAMLCGTGAQAAPSSDYLQRFQGSWSGGGTVLLSLDGNPLNASCHLSPRLGTGRVVLSGRCNLKFLSFLSRKIDATLVQKPGSDSYTGTYVVDDGPPALMSGRRSGDNLTLNVRWPKPVMGHTRAVIRITNDGHTFRMRTIDPLGSKGAPVTTSDLAFKTE